MFARWAKTLVGADTGRARSLAERWFRESAGQRFAGLRVPGLRCVRGARLALMTDTVAVAFITGTSTTLGAFLTALATTRGAAKRAKAELQKAQTEDDRLRREGLDKFKEKRRDFYTSFLEHCANRPESPGTEWRKQYETRFYKALFVAEDAPAQALQDNFMPPYTGRASNDHLRDLIEKMRQDTAVREVLDVTAARAQNSSVWDRVLKAVGWRE
jgi:hypothetical protein